MNRYTPEDYKPKEFKKYEFKTQPFAHQKKALAESWLRPYYALLFEMGGGKTKCMIDTAAVQYIHGLINGVLIIAPKGVYRNWTEIEIPTHMPDGIDYRAMYWKSKNLQGKKYAQELSVFLSSLHDRLDIFSINVEALVTKAGFDACMKFVQSHDTLTIVDESTRIKNPQAVRTKNAIKIARESKYRRILTGTPITKSPLDLYSQCDFLSPATYKPKAGISIDNPLGFSNYISFRSRYAVMKEISGSGPYAIKFPVAYINQDELAEKLKKFSSRVLKTDCLDLPDKLYTTRNVELTEEQRRLYVQMKEEAKAELAGLSAQEDTIYAKSALTQLLRLHQLSCGFITNKDKQVLEIENNRIQELLALLLEINLDAGKVIIWSNFVPAIEQIISALKAEYGDDSVVHFYGKTSADDREKAKELFQDPTSPVKFFVGNPASAGMGITLTQAHTTIYYSNSFDLEHRLQSEDRCHRIGQKNNVTYIDFIATPVDAYILKKLKGKLNIATAVVDRKEIEEMLKE